MNREAIIGIFRSVPVWRWPYVWLQLVVLFGWMNRTQCEVLIRVDHCTGRIRIAFVQDAPPVPEPWRAVVPRVPAWRRVQVAAEGLIGLCARRAAVPVLYVLSSCILRARFVHRAPAVCFDSS